MEKTFVDPLLHSRELLSFQLALLMFFFGSALVALFTFWYFSGASPKKLLDYLIMGSIIIAAMGVTFYMLKRNRRAHADHTWFVVSEWGLKSKTIAGLIEAPWEEVEEIRIGGRPSSSRSPDILVRTRQGYIYAMMRWMESSAEIPEPVLLKPGRAFRYSNGEEICLSPESSQMVTALREHAPPGIIKEGVLITL